MHVKGWCQADDISLLRQRFSSADKLAMISSILAPRAVATFPHVTEPMESPFPRHEVYALRAHYPLEGWIAPAESSGPGWDQPSLGLNLQCLCAQLQDMVWLLSNTWGYLQLGRRRPTIRGLYFWVMRSGNAVHLDVMMNFIMPVGNGPVVPISYAGGGHTAYVFWNGDTQAYIQHGFSHYGTSTMWLVLVSLSSFALDIESSHLSCWDVERNKLR